MTDRLILMVDDNDEDFFATNRIFKKLDYGIELHRAKNTDQALDFLLSRGVFAENKGKGITPSLILLDLNMPGTDGREFLVELKRDDRFKETPVVILTTSNNPRDISYCYRHGANGYQIKSVGFEKYFTSIKTMLNYWFETVTLPSNLN